MLYFAKILGTVGADETSGFFLCASLGRLQLRQGFFFFLSPFCFLNFAHSAGDGSAIGTRDSGNTSKDGRYEAGWV